MNTADDLEIALTLQEFYLMMRDKQETAGQAGDVCRYLFLDHILTEAMETLCDLHERLP
jgi:hypothetical protein